MDIKLKNRHKLAVVVIIVTILAPAASVLSNYGNYFSEAAAKGESACREYIYSPEFLQTFFEAGYLLYDAEGSDGTYLAEKLRESGGYFSGLYPYLDYCACDAQGNLKAFSCSENDLRALKAGNFSGYALGLAIEYDDSGLANVKKVYGENSEEIEIGLKRLLAQPWAYEGIRYMSDGMESELAGMADPTGRTYYYALTEDHLEEYLHTEAMENMAWTYTMPDDMVFGLCIALLAVAAAAFLYPFFCSWNTGNEKIFRAPVELVAVVFVSVAVCVSKEAVNLLIRNGGRADVWDVLFWIAVFAAAYWTAGCFRQIFVLGPAAYIRERSFLYLSKEKIRSGLFLSRDKARDAYHFAGKQTKAAGEKLYRIFDRIELDGKSNRALIEIAFFNFLVMAVCCLMWGAGIFAAAIYSVFLFLVMKHYLEGLKEKYALLHDAANQMAEGNLGVEIDGELGVFAPIGEELTRIQDGYQVAVQREVKSQRMKTELITNVSHDLKTPLTAIITYVDLLKKEEDEEKRREYTDVLERKSMRLKTLIEDLFEISRASSGDVTLELMDVDIVSLFKQVLTEVEEKFAEAQLDTRCVFPEEKLTVRLDSQKTYRIFENLLVNASKYALKNTRVYVKIGREGNEAVVSMMNVSAQELNFSPEEITERFVRGDLSRNTEGSGLGLAIVKSFTELQKGRFEIETEGDLFKTRVIFPAV